MCIYSYKEFSPIIAEGCYIAPGAMLIGNVKLGFNVSIWHNTVVRGDMDEIIIRENSNVQDLCMLHVDYNVPLHIGKNVTVGHHAVLHGCTIEDHCLIGMGAVILDGARIGKNSLVAARALVTPGKEFPPGSMIVGSPAKVKRELTQEELEGYGNIYSHYIDQKNNYLDMSLVKKIK